MKTILSKFMNAVTGKKKVSDPGAARGGDVQHSLITQMAPGATGSAKEPPYTEPYKHTVQSTPGKAPIIEWC